MAYHFKVLSHTCGLWKHPQAQAVIFGTEKMFMIFAQEYVDQFSYEVVFGYQLMLDFEVSFDFTRLRHWNHQEFTVCFVNHAPKSYRNLFQMIQ